MSYGKSGMIDVNKQFSCVCIWGGGMEMWGCLSNRFYYKIFELLAKLK